VPLSGNGNIIRTCLYKAYAQKYHLQFIVFMLSAAGFKAVLLVRKQLGYGSTRCRCHLEGEGLTYYFLD